jgi:hypothetical protein
LRLVSDLIGILSENFVLLREGLSTFFQECLYELGALEHLPSPSGDSLAKFMLSLREENFKLLTSEADDRGITVQELIRAVIIPDWVKVNTLAKPSSDKIRAITVNSREPLIQPMGRLRS